jgi:hypothetical protein
MVPSLLDLLLLTLGSIIFALALTAGNGAQGFLNISRHGLTLLAISTAHFKGNFAMLIDLNLNPFHWIPPRIPQCIDSQIFLDLEMLDGFSAVGRVFPMKAMPRTVLPNSPDLIQ